jgi:prepilin-type N-terminal cleavage/methylation domain-containing protein
MNRRGVTLLELLIAVSLLSLLSVGVLMAMRVGLDAMQKTNSRLMDNRRVARAQRILEEQIAGFMPLVADCLPGPDRPRVRMPFFQGEPESMRFLSSYSLTEGARGYPRILEFQVIPGENNRGVRLVVNEHLYTGPAGAGMFCLGMGPDPLTGAQVPLFRPIEVGPYSFVLADRLAYCRFWYREAPPPPAPERWVPRWVQPQWPRAIRIEMAPLEPDPSRVQPMELIAPVRVNKIPMTEYVD